MKADLGRRLPVEIPEGLVLAELDQSEDIEELQWLFWQGFDHGVDRAEFEREETVVPRIRPHFDRSLSLAAFSPSGEPVSCCCLWCLPGTDYAYVEPVCTIPSWRGRGAATAVMAESMGRAADLGAKAAYVISDLAFYEGLGFKKELSYTFYRKA